MLRVWAWIAAFMWLGAVAPAHAQTEPIGQMPLSVTTVVPAGSYVDFEIVDPLNSKLSKPGDRFRIRTTAPVTLNGAVAIPAGALGEGEVIHAARARAAGKAGELILAARFIDHAGQRIALRSFRFAQAGTSRMDEAIVVGLIATPVVLFMAGSDVDVPPGARGQAKLVADLPIMLPASGN